MSVFELALGDNVRTLQWACFGSSSPGMHIALNQASRFFQKEIDFVSLIKEAKDALEEASLLTGDVQKIFANRSEYDFLMHDLGMWAAMPASQMFGFLESWEGQEPTQQKVVFVCVIYDMAVTRAMTLLKNKIAQLGHFF